MDNPDTIGSRAGAGMSGDAEPHVSELPPRIAVNVGALVAPNSPAAESLSGLRNYLVGQHLQMGRRALAICAPHEASGCTYLSTNLALAMAQTGVNTLLIDGNLRNPGIGETLTTNHPVLGLSEYLSADDDQPPYLLANARPNLSIIYAGKAADSSSELLAKQKLKLLINESVRSFDLTIVDCPPSAHFGDARRIASLVRYALVVVRRDHSYSSDVKTLVKELQSDGVNVVGTFLNIVD